MSTRSALRSSWNGARRLGVANEASIAGAMLEMAGGDADLALSKLATVRHYLELLENEEAEERRVIQERWDARMKTTGTGTGG